MVEARPAGERIERFLADHPRGGLTVAVGYATAAGLAWLNRRTQGRAVCLVIGNARQKYWKKVTPSDREECLAFLRRGDVEVHNWYRTGKSRHGKSQAHLKTWVVHDRGSALAALSGSANLTLNGLESNIELMSETHGQDMHQAWDAVRELAENAWPCQDRLIGYLTSQEDQSTVSETLSPGGSRQAAAPPPRGHRQTRMSRIKTPEADPGPRALDEDAEPISPDGYWLPDPSDSTRLRYRTRPGAWTDWVFEDGEVRLLAVRRRADHSSPQSPGGVQSAPAAVPARPSNRTNRLLWALAGLSTLFVAASLAYACSAESGESTAADAPVRVDEAAVEREVAEAVDAVSAKAVLDIRSAADEAVAEAAATVEAAVPPRSVILYPGGIG